MHGVPTEFKGHLGSWSSPSNLGSLLLGSAVLFMVAEHKSLGFSWLCLVFHHKSTGITHAHCQVWFAMGSGVSDSGPHACVANVLDSPNRSHSSRFACS